MKNIINVIIIDDEESYASSLEILLKKNFPKINVIGSSYSVKDGVNLLSLTKPDLVFLDINMPDGSGFDLLERIKEKSFEVIFTTSFSEFAFRAFEVAALHYLMKPMTLEKLTEAMERYEKMQGKDDFDEKLRILKESLLEKPQKILLPLSDGQTVFNISDIVRCEAEGSYSRVFFNNNTKELICKPLQNLDRLLNELDFVRIHNSHLVNLRYVKKYVPGKSATVQLSDKTELPISQSQKPDFSLRLKKYAKTM